MRLKERATCAQLAERMMLSAERVAFTRAFIAAKPLIRPNLFRTNHINVERQVVQAGRILNGMSELADRSPRCEACQGSCEITRMMAIGLRLLQVSDALLSFLKTCNYARQKRFPWECRIVAEQRVRAGGAIERARACS